MATGGEAGTWKGWDGGTLISGREARPLTLLAPGPTPDSQVHCVFRRTIRAPFKHYKVFCCNC